MSIIGKNIKKIRILHNLNQQAMGELFQISRGSIGSYEEGRAEPKLETAIRIATHFNLSLDKILTKELTVNELSDYTNIISNHFEESIKSTEIEQKPKETRLFLEQRVAILEEKLNELEKMFKEQFKH